MLRLLVILLAVFLITGCRVGSGGGVNFGSDSILDSGNDMLSTTPLSPDSSSDSDGASGAHTPEPTTLILFGIGLSGLLAAKLVKRKRL